MVQLFKPCMGEDEVEAVSQVVRSGWLGLGPKTAEFEKRFAEYIGTTYAVGVNSCTSALDLALKLLDIKNGDEVIVPGMTFVSTAHVVAYNLATPIFADVSDDMLINFDDIEKKITRRTKAVIPVHYSGRPVHIPELRKRIRSDIHVIEDVAHACGALLDEKRCGSLGDIGCFSFHAVKNLSMGDGGALTLSSEEMTSRAKKLRWLGIDKGTWERTEADKSYWWQYFVEEIGLKCHMNDLTAAIGLVQLAKLDTMNKRRKEIADFYSRELMGIPQVTLPPADTASSKSAWHIYCLQCDHRDELSKYLEANQVNIGVHYKPIHLYSCYGNITSLPNSERLFTKILSLPMHPGLSDNEIHKVVDTIKMFYCVQK